MPAGVAGEVTDIAGLALAKLEDESPVPSKQRRKFPQEPAVEQEAVWSGTQGRVWVVVPDFGLESGNLRLRNVWRITYHEIGRRRKCGLWKSLTKVALKEPYLFLKAMKAQVFPSKRKRIR